MLLKLTVDVTVLSKEGFPVPRGEWILQVLHFDI